MKVLVTGGIGLIGSACLDLFLKEGHEVISVDNNTRKALFGNDADNELNAQENNFKQAGKIRVWFHAWEYLIIWTAIWLWQGWYKIGLITSLPYFSHLLMDHFGNETCGPFYFLLYRLKNNFDIRKLCRKLCQKPQ